MITKPLRISRIDRTNPLCRGLAFCIPFNEMAGIPAALLATTNLSAASIGSGTWAATGINIASLTTPPPYWTTPAGQFGTGDFTVLSYEITPAAATNSYSFTNNGPTGNQSTATWWGMAPNLTDAIAAGSGHYSFLTASASAITNVGAAGMLDGKPHVFVGRRSGTTHEVYRDGIRANVRTGTARNVNSGGEIIAGLRFGNAYANVAAGARILAIGWNRALSPAEIALISANPWQLLAQSSPSRLLRMMSPGGTAFSGMSRGRILAGISRGRISCGY